MSVKRKSTIAMYSTAVLCAGYLSSSSMADVVVPAMFTSTDAAQIESRLLRTGTPIHYQMQITEVGLGISPGTQITGLAWRQDVTRTGSQPTADTAWPQFEIRLAQATYSLANQNNLFSANMLNPVLVRNTLTIPANSFPGTAQSPSANNFYTIAFDTPYTYQGGDLVIDINRGTGDPSATIRVDATTEGLGTVFNALYSFGEEIAYGNINFAITKVVTVPYNQSPANDHCGEARSMTNEYEYLFDTTLADTDGSVSCAESANDVWFKFAAPPNWVRSGTAIFTVNTNSFVPVLSAYADSCGSTPIVCTTNGQTQCQLEVPVNLGQTIYVRVAGVTGQGLVSGTGTLSVVATAPPVNDYCSTAISLALGGTYGFDTTLADTDGSASCAGSTNDVWFSYTASSTWPNYAAGTATFTVNADSFVPVLSAYADSCSGTPVGCAINGQTQCQLTTPINAGQTIYMRVAGAATQAPASGDGIISVSVSFPPSLNAFCNGAELIASPGDYPFDMIWAGTGESANGFDGCALFANYAKLWYTYAAPNALDGQKIEFDARVCDVANPPGRFGGDGSFVLDGPCGSTIGGCGSSCGTGSEGAHHLTYLSAGEQVWFAMQSGVPTGTISLPGSFNVLATPVSVWLEAEDAGEEETDAGSLPESAHVVSGTGPLDRIAGGYEPLVTDVDMYKIRICDKEQFSATTRNSSTFPGSNTNPWMFLFDESGKGVAAGDILHDLTGEFIPSNGIYYIAVSASGFPLSNGSAIWNFGGCCLTSFGQPTGPGATGVVNGWTTGGFSSGTYRIALTGAVRVDTVCCAADFNGINGVTVQDIFDFLTAWLAGNSSADFNHVNGVTVQDIFDFLTAWLAGC